MVHSSDCLTVLRVVQFVFEHWNFDFELAVRVDNNETCVNISTTLKSLRVGSAPSGPPLNFYSHFGLSKVIGFESKFEFAVAS